MTDDKKKLFKRVVDIVIAFVTALVTALTTTSCYSFISETF